MPKKSRKRKARGVADVVGDPIPDLDTDPTTGAKMYHVREIDYLAYNTIFSIQQLLNTLNRIEERQQTLTVYLARIESKLDEYLIPGEEESSGNQGIKAQAEVTDPTEGGEGGTTED